MQTLKTAAIVVLVMCVIYGAYVSLTTPPEPLPPNVEDMLVLSDDGSSGLDSVLPPSLGELEINTGVADSAAEVVQPADTIAANLMQPESFATSDQTVPSTDDLPPDLSGKSTAASSASFSMSDNQPSTTAVMASAEGGSRQYPQTNRTFAMPDPDAIQASFDPNLGQGFAEPSAAASDSSASVTQVSAIGNQPNSTDKLGTDSLGGGGNGSSNLGLVNALQIADRQYANDQSKEALATLSIFYNTPNLTGEERAELVGRLDWLAGVVIYSQRHLLESPHRVGKNQTLVEIADLYEVPWQLLANINQIQDPMTVLPGTELKIVRGPFRAEVDLSQKELTLFLGDLYAGRFPIGVGSDPMPRSGTYTVQDKQNARTFYDASGSPIPPGSRDNPYGDQWIDLGGQNCIHGSPNKKIANEDGCISLAGDNADDLYAILSQGSSVVIRE